MRVGQHQTTPTPPCLSPPLSRVVHLSIGLPHSTPSPMPLTPVHSTTAAPHQHQSMCASGGRRAAVRLSRSTAPTLAHVHKWPARPPESHAAPPPPPPRAAAKCWQRPNGMACETARLCHAFTAAQPPQRPVIYQQTTGQSRSTPPLWVHHPFSPPPAHLGHTDRSIPLAAAPGDSPLHTCWPKPDPNVAKVERRCCWRSAGTLLALCSPAPARAPRLQAAASTRCCSRCHHPPQLLRRSAFPPLPAPFPFMPPPTPATAAPTSACRVRARPSTSSAAASAQAARPPHIRPPPQRRLRPRPQRPSSRPVGACACVCVEKHKEPKHKNSIRYAMQQRDGLSICVCVRACACSFRESAGVTKLYNPSN